MPLAKYRQKRDFTKTREPSGSAAPRKRTKKLIFVVQHHIASHDHDDFRLELGGVLRSWAVPKRISLSPDDRRLAVQVEDHPLGYATFAGKIPEGNYGAGRVWVWDHGTWETDDPDPAAALEAGKLSFTLRGKKMKGEWTLVRFKNSRQPRNGKAQWLLMKHAAAGTTRE
jgi:bifunctional non-homologous end joining protein LigD